MSIKKHNGHTFSVGDPDEAILSNIDMMGSDDPVIAATARLNRDLVAVTDKWLADAFERVEDGQLDLTDVLSSTMHGVTSVCGTILVNVPADKREMVYGIMKERIDAVLASMFACIQEESEGGGDVTPTT